MSISVKEASPLPRVKPAPSSSAISVPFVYTPSGDGTDENLLILLHGLGGQLILSIEWSRRNDKKCSGDTHIPFAGLGRQLKLPQTAVLALRGSEQLVVVLQRYRTQG